MRPLPAETKGSKKEDWSAPSPQDVMAEMKDKLEAAKIIDRFRLDDKVVVLTASSGLGVALAEELAGAGAYVALGARWFERLSETQKRVAQLGRRTIALQTDVSDPRQCQRLVGETIAAFGQVDVLINNAWVGSAYQPPGRPLISSAE